VNKGLREVRIVELCHDDAASIRLHYSYLTEGYYDLSMSRAENSWKIELTLRRFEKPLEKTSESRFFEEFVEEPRVFAAKYRGEQVGWVELGYHKWNNRMRIWEFLVKPEFRGKGVGTLLMRHAAKVAKVKGARMLVLETQSCNVPAIRFYLKQGFDLVGFDSASYSNNDVEKKEVRVELGLRLQ
jgi:ribosomal protein S18 acetylase RimI-like enzyme